MMKLMFISLLLICLCSGCPDGRAAFVDVVQDHRSLTVETMDAVVKSVHDDAETSWDQLDESERKAVLDLIARLEMISRQSIVIDEYVRGNTSPEVIKELIKNRWKEGLQRKGAQ